MRRACASSCRCRAARRKAFHDDQRAVDSPPGEARPAARAVSAEFSGRRARKKPPPCALCRTGRSWKRFWPGSPTNRPFYGGWRGATRPGCCASARKSPTRRSKPPCAAFRLPRARLREAHAMSLLRRAKQEVALIVALADLLGEYDVVAATRALSRRRTVSSSPPCVSPCAFPPKSSRSPIRTTRARLWPRHSRPWETWRAGAELFSDVDLVVFYDLRSPVARRRAGGQSQFPAPDRACGEAVAGAHRRRLRLPRRPAPAPRPGSTAAGGVASTRRWTITRASARTGSGRR